ncbi:tumor necrosis factor receptor superfamily member 6 isoform X3 [Pitangus sulphuratus]|nr:tumor necrosis factor receptor superfamily member 6 isoform X3 [Pitangus sulphuratus]
MTRGLLPLLLVAVLIIEAQCKNDTEDLMHIDYNRRIIARREINCKQDEYNLDGQCCKKCKSGFVKNITCPTDTSKHCAQCESGKEYIDHLNDLTECRRCSSCDSVFGKRKQKGLTTKDNLSEVVFKVEPSCESVPLIDTDADLSSHIAGIVEEMTFQQVLTFIRHHHVPEPAIDQAIRDCPGDTSEQKIRLFRTCYPTVSNGINTFSRLQVSEDISGIAEAAGKHYETPRITVMHSEAPGMPDSIPAGAGSALAPLLCWVGITAVTAAHGEDGHDLGYIKGS